MRTVCLFLLVILAAATARADQGYPYPGMMVMATSKSFADLSQDLEAAVAANRMGLVTQASASAGAARRDVEVALELVEAAQAEEGIAQDQQGPALAQHRKCSGH